MHVRGHDADAGLHDLSDDLEGPAMKLEDLLLVVSGSLGFVAWIANKPSYLGLAKIFALIVWRIEKRH